MTHEEQRRVGVLLREMLSPELEVCELVLPARLPVRALVRGVECRTPKPAAVVREDGDVVRGVTGVNMLVSGTVFSEAVVEEHDGLGERRGVRARVELKAVAAGQPGLKVTARGCARRHGGRRRVQRRVGRGRGALNRRMVGVPYMLLAEISIAASRAPKPAEISSTLS